MTGDLRAGVERGHERPGGEDAGDRGDGADDDRQPEAVDALGEGRAEVAGAEVARDAGRGAVGEEDAEADDGLQDHRGDAEAGELGRAEVADDRGVREQEERLGHEGQESGHGEAQDLAVDGFHEIHPRNSGPARASATSDIRGIARCE